ncbi:hypothetical protein CKO35_01330 [Ectothiorhodospira shaposhnikovii]|uniref:hypothetical protein n=1 Tax=Ectothiorhodospira shaposhnikovii TaxID=1054 RepID=UPI001903C4E9|nr:hypothetical protein [Ectothiorhodospira shaposhnikovii]MBK1671957.1 hypothetical protein [Ectothiorhodospira shaposhnikovii]
MMDVTWSTDELRNICADETRPMAVRAEAAMALGERIRHALPPEQRTELEQEMAQFRAFELVQAIH